MGDTMTDQDTVQIELADIDDADTLEIPSRTVSADVRSRKSYNERRAFERFDDVITKVEDLSQVLRVRGAA